MLVILKFLKFYLQAKYYMVTHVKIAKHESDVWGCV